MKLSGRNLASIRKTGRTVEVLSISGRMVQTSGGTFDVTELAKIQPSRNERLHHTTGPTNQVRKFDAKKRSR